MYFINLQYKGTCFCRFLPNFSPFLTRFYSCYLLEALPGIGSKVRLIRYIQTCSNVVCISSVIVPPSPPLSAGCLSMVRPDFEGAVICSGLNGADGTLAGTCNSSLFAACKVAHRNEKAERSGCRPGHSNRNFCCVGY